MRYYISVVSAGGNPVKMAPEAFTAGVRIINMLFIAVYQDKVPFRNRGNRPVQLQHEFPLLYIHQKKIIVGVPAKIITRLIKETAALQGIKENIPRCFAGRINKVLRFIRNKIFTGFHGFFLLQGIPCFFI